MQDVSRVFMSRLQEHTIDWFQGGSHNLSICLLRIDKRFNWNLLKDKIKILQRFLKRSPTSSCLKEMSFWRRLVVWLDIWLIKLSLSST